MVTRFKKASTDRLLNYVITATRILQTRGVKINVQY